MSLIQIIKYINYNKQFNIITKITVDLRNGDDPDNNNTLTCSFYSFSFPFTYSRWNLP